MFCAAQDDALILYQDSLVLVISLMGCSIECVASAWRYGELCAVFLVEVFSNKRRPQSHLNMLRVTFGDYLGKLF